MKFFYVNLQAYKLQPSVFFKFLNVFLKFLKTAESTSVVEFLITGAGTTGSLQNDKFWKTPKKTSKCTWKDTTMDVLLKSVQKFREQLFCPNTNRHVLLKIQTNFL